MKKTALIFGVFDLTHYGHYEKFKQLHIDGYKVIAGVVTDEFTESYKRKPIMTTNERVNNIEHCKYVDEIIVSSGCFVTEVEAIKPDIIAQAGWDRKAYMKHMGFTEEWLKEQNIELIELPYTEGVSTSELIERVKRRW